jgi:aspartyl-tRNA(Asn)/glutamyl-tRNA(Gln) amidotransferase subunit A
MTEISRRRFLAASTATVVAAAAPAAARASRSAAPTTPDPSSIDTTDLTALSLLQCASLLQSGKVSSVELTQACLDRIHAKDGAITAWIRLYPDYAISLARAADARLASGTQSSLLCGIPLGLKDLYAVKGLPVTASSKVLAGNVASADSTVWMRLRGAGMVLLGHTHTDEFAVGVGTPQTGNPWDPNRSPGGSSGGSGAALGARMTPAATGTDTGGSLRLPATACGTTSLKPSFGRVSAYGVIPLLWTRDHAGPMARSAADAAALLSAMAGPDQNDPSTLCAPPPPAAYPLGPSGGSKPLTGKRFGVVAASVASLPAATATLFSEFLTQLTALGASVVDVTMPALPSGGLGTAELAETGAYHQQFAPTSLPKYRLEIGAIITACIAAQESATGDYLAIQRDRVRFMHDYNRLFADRQLFAVLYPGSTMDGATREEVAGLTFLSGSVSGDVSWANYAGVPALCTPIGRSSATGMPFGAQIGVLPHQEAELLQMAIDYQAAYPFWKEAPTLADSPRDVPTAQPVDVPAGAKPDPTNTDAKHPAYQIVPTLSVDQP